MIDYNAKTYIGVYEGQEWKSIHPFLFRVRYTRRFNGKLWDVDTIKSGHNVDSLRDRIIWTRRGELASDVIVEHVFDLSINN